MVFLWWKKDNQKQTTSRTSRLFLPTLLVLLYAVTYPFVPPLARACIAVVAIGCMISALRYGMLMHPGVCGLLLLSLPVIPSSQFYLGYPLRIMVAKVAAPVLQIGGFAVVQEGTCLNWAGQLIWVDAPCSGVQMLWAGLYLAFTLVCLYDLRFVKTCFVASISIVAINLGNVFRAVALFYVEAGVIAFPSWVHEAIGIVAFLATSLFVIWFVQWIWKRELHFAHSSLRLHVR